MRFYSHILQISDQQNKKPNAFHFIFHIYIFGVGKFVNKDFENVRPEIHCHQCTHILPHTGTKDAGRQPLHSQYYQDRCMLGKMACQDDRMSFLLTRLFVLVSRCRPPQR